MNLINSRVYRALKKNQFVYFCKYAVFNRDYKLNRKMRFNALKNLNQIRFEENVLKEYWGCPSLHYTRYALFNKDLSLEELKDYIPPYFHYNFYTPALYKDTDMSLYNNKLLLYNHFSNLRIPTPKVIATVHEKSLCDLQFRPLDITSLKFHGPLFFKPCCGEGGSGIVVFEGGDLALFMKHLSKTTDYVIQEKIHQRDDISAINSSSVNTLRVVTQWRDDHLIIPVCVMRIGRNGKFVDNSHQGGLSVQIDVKSGAFYPYAMSEHGGERLASHPDSGYVFKNHSIADWDNIKSFIIATAEKFPELPEIAWDVAITDNGAEMIELNLGYGIDHLQCTCGGLRRVLGIYPLKK